jgi:hypothetical protein
MDYALVKELKDAGFPQENRDGHYEEANGRYGWGPSKKTVYVPTLEELIEAIGEDRLIKAIQDGVLFRLTKQVLGEYWLALNRTEAAKS